MSSKYGCSVIFWLLSFLVRLFFQSKLALAGHWSAPADFCGTFSAILMWTCLQVTSLAAVFRQKILLPWLVAFFVVKWLALLQFPQKIPSPWPVPSQQHEQQLWPLCHLQVAEFSRFGNFFHLRLAVAGNWSAPAVMWPLSSEISKNVLLNFSCFFFLI
jgi:hypothetical protein